MIVTALFLLTCRPIDGDTIRCGSERIRLVGIDAPEMPGHCRRGRVCVDGDPRASQRSLRRALQSGPIRIRRITTDRYGRTVADVFAGDTDLSCWQLLAGQAAYKRRWDTGGRIGRRCPMP